jgi:hypothetical protein
MVLGERRGRYLKQYPCGGGYLGVKFSKQGKYRTMQVHVLVAETFLNRPEGIVEVNHNDGNKWNNNLSNLEWMTKSENRLHAIHVLGVKITLPPPKYGEDHPNSKLTEQEVRAIREGRKSGLSYVKLGKRYGVDQSTIAQIVKRKTWKEIPE